MRSPVGASFFDSLALLRTRKFGTFWFSSLLSSIGTWAQSVAQPWLLLSLGASAMMVGLDGFAMSAPVWLLTLTGGMLADRADRRKVIAWFQSIQMLCPTLIVVLLLYGHIRPWMIVALSLVVGITDALSMPSFSSIVPMIVERKQIGAGIALNSTQFNLSRIIGPALAGVLMSSVGAAACFVVSALSYIPFIGVAVWIIPPVPKHLDHALEQEVRHPVLGLGEILREPLQRGALLTTLCGGLLCAPIITFCPVLVRTVFNGSAAQFSVAVGAFGIGGLIGGIAMLGVPNTTDRRHLSSWAAAAYGATLVAVAVAPVFWMVPLLLAAGGCAMSVSNTSTNTLVQSAAAPGQLGRSVSLYMLGMRGGIALGALITGVTVHLMGVREALLLNGVLALIAQAFISRAWFAAPSVSPQP